MKKIILLTAICTLPGVANAGLQVSATPNDLGKLCYSESGKYGTMYACNPNGAYVDMDQEDYECPSDPTTTRPLTWYNDIPGECFVGESDGIKYFCSVSAGGDNSCGLCNFGEKTGSWTDIGGNRVSRTHQIPQPIPEHEQIGWTCTAVITNTTEYGCAARHYTDASTGSATMTCTPCPDGGTVGTGNLKKTNCYVTAGTEFSDSTGSGTYTSTCRWTE